VRTAAELLGDVAALQDLAPEHQATIAACATLAVFRPGEPLLCEGEPADAFFLLRDGAVALETVIPGRGRVTVETLHAGDVLGWSWIVPPYRTAFSARSRGITRAVRLDGACLREKCERDPALGYAVLKLLGGVLARRLQDARVRLLDLYGTPDRA